MANGTMPTVSGPVQGGRGWPFGSPAWDASAVGYTVEEYFLEGEATSYRAASGTAAGVDGRWHVEPYETASYKTRIYVVVPQDPTAFNGTVLVNWQNVTLGCDLGMPEEDHLTKGYAWVGVTTQRVAMEGQPSLAVDMSPMPGLCEWDPERYGTLHHPGDAFSYDIYTQAVRYLREGRTEGIDVLHGLEPQRYVALGGSQSAMRLGSYINIAHAKARVIDGYFLTVHWGLCPPPPDMSLVESFGFTEELRFAGNAQIRDDGGTPILVLNSESEALMVAMVRQPDSDTFRFWEMAGTAHAGGDLMESMTAAVARDGLQMGDGLSALPKRNTVRWDYVQRAGLANLVDWVVSGNIPPSIEPIGLDADQPGAFRTDRFGNALGGVRLPDLVAPLAVHSGSNDLGPAAALSGQTTPFSPEQIAELYADAATYQEAWDGAVDDLAALGLVLSDDVAEVKRRGAEHAALVERSG
jgi:hypothetical protein